MGTLFAGFEGFTLSRELILAKTLSWLTESIHSCRAPPTSHTQVNSST
jgi:hypothetical protein